MSKYEIYMYLDLLESFPRKGSQRKKIMDFIYGLRDRPFTLGDYFDQDSTLRTRQIKVIGDYAITFWLDDPAKIVMIVDVRPADK
jgi:hypothetical protein